jgi:nucleotide-binding universal stress UspA family protein
MKILIAVSSQEYSGPTLSVGMKVARAFKADVTIAYVGEKIGEFSTKVVGMAQERMESWDFDRPGVDVLEWAFEYLAEKEFIERTDIEAGFPKNTLVHTGGNRLEVYLKGTICEDVNLILRNGEIIPELRDEVKNHGYDVTIIGGSKKRNMAHDLVQYIDSSIFVVKNFQSDKNYSLLLSVNDAPNTRKAVKYGIRVAQAFDLNVTALTVSDTSLFREGYKSSSKWASKLLRRCGINHHIKLEEGKFHKTVVLLAGDDHIIVMGASTKSPLSKFFKGSKPLKVMNACQGPILIVKS